jgi:hypothetical protein
MIRYISFCIIAVLLCACGSPEDSDHEMRDDDSVATITPERDDEQYPGATGATGPVQNGDDVTAVPERTEEQSRLVVSFISQGEGIDKKTHDAFVMWVKQKGNIRYDAHSWGREGEMNYCFALENLSPAEQDEFVEEVRAQLIGKQQVYINEHADCSTGL